MSRSPTLPPMKLVNPVFEQAMAFEHAANDIMLFLTQQQRNASERDRRGAR